MPRILYTDETYEAYQERLDRGRYLRFGESIRPSRLSDFRVRFRDDPDLFIGAQVRSGSQLAQDVAYKLSGSRFGSPADPASNELILIREREARDALRREEQARVQEQQDAFRAALEFETITINSPSANRSANTPQETAVTAPASKYPASDEMSENMGHTVGSMARMNAGLQNLASSIARDLKAATYTWDQFQDMLRNCPSQESREQVTQLLGAQRGNGGLLIIGRQTP